MTGAASILKLEGALVIVSRPQGAPSYDFDFDLAFETTHPPIFSGELCLFRIGAIRDYAEASAEARNWGLEPAMSEDAHLLASDMRRWLPYLRELTPETEIYAAPPSAEEAGARFGWPLFMKGARQTARHRAKLSILETPADYAAAAAAYVADPILSWQPVALRRFERLEPVAGGTLGKIPPSLEFRSFWFDGALVGVGRYWLDAEPYAAPDLDDGLAVAAEAARRLAARFLVVDFAKTVDGRWRVIECNDAQEAGYVGAPPRALWRAVIDKLRKAA